MGRRRVKHVLHVDRLESELSRLSTMLDALPESVKATATTAVRTTSDTTVAIKHVRRLLLPFLCCVLMLLLLFLSTSLPVKRLSSGERSVGDGAVAVAGGEHGCGEDMLIGCGCVL